MNPVDEQLTRKVAELARLELSPEEVRTFTSQIGEILTYVEQMNGVDTTGILPLIHPHDSEENQVSVLREDVVLPSAVDANGRPKTLTPAPEALRDGFKVPPVL